MLAIILAGGFGTRLQSTIGDIPKALAPIHGRAFISYLLDYLHAQGVTEVALCLHHLHQSFYVYFRNHPPPMTMHFITEPQPLGTGGALAFALERLKPNKPVIALNGDSLVQVDYRALMKEHIASKRPLTLVLRQVRNRSRYSAVSVENNCVSEFQLLGGDEAGLISAGVYVLEPDIFQGKKLPAIFSMEKDFFVPYAAKLGANTHLMHRYFIDIGVPEDYARANDELPRLFYKKALFLDRDGVINIDKDYLYKIEEVEYIAGIFELCRKAKAKGYRLIVVTNQSGIGRGLFTEQDFEILSDAMAQRFEEEDATLDAIYYCPHHPSEGLGSYRQHCEGRKPGAGMLIAAAERFGIDLSSSILIGDKERDIEAGRKAGLKMTLLFSEQPTETRANAQIKSLKQAVKFL